MRRRKRNAYTLMIAILIVLVTIIFCLCATMVKAEADKIAARERINAEHRTMVIAAAADADGIKSKKELEDNITYLEPNLVMLKYEEPTDLSSDDTAETSYDGKGGLECDSKEDVEHMACVIYQEAGGDACCDMCRRRVADVVLNRVKDPRFKGTTIDEILLDADPAPQWGLYSVTGIVWPEKASYPEEAAAVQRAWDTAFDVLEGNHSDLTEDYIWCAEFPQGTDVIECCGIYFGK